MLLPLMCSTTVKSAKCAMNSNETTVAIRQAHILTSHVVIGTLDVHVC